MGVEQLDVDVMIRRSGCNLGLRRSAAFAELPVSPTTCYYQPRSFWCCLCGGAYAVKPFLKRAHAKPMHLRVVAKACTNGVNVRIDQTGDDCAATEINDPGRGVSQRADTRRIADRGDSSVAHCQRLCRRAVIDDKLAIDENGVRRGNLNLRVTGVDPSQRKK